MSERNATPTGDAFDALTKALARDTVSRRRGLHTLGAGIVAAALGTLAISGDAEGKKRRRRKNKKKNNNNDNNNDNQAPPPTGGNASANCRDDNDQCGSNANDQGSCRRAAAADNQGGFICSSDQSTGVTCQTSNQCGGGTRCVEVGGGNECRVVIN
jgi:hypothetical protein